MRNRREDGLDMVSGMRSAMNRCQQGGTKLAQLVHRAVFYDPRVPGGSGAIFEIFCKFLAGLFSAVSKQNFARKYAFDSIFQALQDLHPFAPLQSQNFRKKSI